MLEVSLRVIAAVQTQKFRSMLDSGLRSSNGDLLEERLKTMNQLHRKWTRTKVNAVVAGIFGLAVSSAQCLAGAAGHSTDPNATGDVGSERHQRVLELQPVGYWPADQVDGDILHDLSPTNNSGVLHHVPWDEGRRLLHFTGAYQWAEIPKHEAYQTPAFSMGGWVFLRSDVIGGRWVNRQGFLLFGNRFHWLNRTGVQLSIRKQELIDVTSDGKEDIMGTRLWRNDLRRAEGEPSLAIGQWHHLIYSFEPDSSPTTDAVNGTGSLYLNGKLIATEEDIRYKPANANLTVGPDAFWWHQIHFKSGSLDGSVRDLVWFDRALVAEEVAQLREASQPLVSPDVYDDRVVVLDGRPIGIDDLLQVSPTTRQNALWLFSRKDEAALQPMAENFIPHLTAALDEPNCRLQAITLLLKLDHPEAAAVLGRAPQLLTAVIENTGSPEKERADAALALAAMRNAVADTVPTLVAALEDIVGPGDVHPPRVEEVLRNSLTRALLEIDPEHEAARQTLGRAFAAPLLASLDERSDEIQRLIDSGQFWEAMQRQNRLPARERERFFTFKPPQDRDYSSTAHFNGITYKVGEGVAWKGVERVPADEYSEIVAELAQTYPEAEGWRSPDYEDLYRVPVTRIDADGNEQRIYLEGRDFILDGEDEKLRGWSIFVDELGYVHLTGGQHNTPKPHEYIPGSWEKMGVSRDSRSDDFPLQMYWVSTEPECIESFEFAGRRSDPQAIPARYMNYMVFEQDHLNNTFLYGRVDALGWQSWGLFHYNATERRWATIGGDPYDLIESARRHNPQWLDYLHDQIRGRVPSNPTDARPLVWAWQPPFYNFCRDNWGVRFDKTNRMHVRMQIGGLDGAGYVRPTSVYAWSDDRGETFHRADGSRVKLPLTVNPAPEHNAEIAVDNTRQHHDGQQYATRQWWDLWLGLLRSAGYRN